MKFSREERGHFLLLGGRVSRPFCPRCWGVGSGGWGLTGPGIFLGLSTPTRTTQKTFQAFSQSQLLQPPWETGRQRSEASPGGAEGPQAPEPPARPGHRPRLSRAAPNWAPGGEPDRKPPATVCFNVSGYREEIKVHST